MSTERWYSTKVRLICLIEQMGGTRYMDSVFLFRAGEFDEAFQRALGIGKKQERSYRNGEGQLVVWKLVELISLDLLRTESLDGAEVYSEPVSLPDGVSIPFGAEFSPETSRPTQSV
jgi:hypothetical protein